MITYGDLLKLRKIKKSLDDPQNSSGHFSGFVEFLVIQKAGLVIELLALREFQKLRGHSLHESNRRLLEEEIQKRWTKIGIS